MLGRSGLISVGDAQRILLQALATLVPQTETLPLEQALRRVLAEDLISAEDLPSQARSTMDGYAVRAADTFGATDSMPCYLNVTGQVQMGQSPRGTVEQGSCHAIPTGGLLPQGADSVVMFEHTVAVDESLIEVVKPVGEAANLILAGEDIRCKELALGAGKRLRAQEIGLLAGLGVQEVKVVKKPRVGILSTGDEIVDFKIKPPAGKIRNINSLALASQARNAGAKVTDYGIVADDYQIFLDALALAASENDLVLFSGGSSVGVRDLGEKVISALGNPGVLVHGVKLRPGKPIIIGLCDQTAVFGLPGHPVSAMVCFDFFVRPAILKISGQQNDPLALGESLRASLSRNINSAPGRLDVVRVSLKTIEDKLVATPILGKSGSISTLSRADGYFIIPEDSQGAYQNSPVEVYLYR